MSANPGLPPRFDEHASRPVPPLELQDGTSLAWLVGVTRRLLGEGGCPWDREQSFETIRKYVLEEACEVIDAIDGGDRQALREELGDLHVDDLVLPAGAREAKPNEYGALAAVIG